MDIEGILALMIPIVALMIPIVKILVNHQQSMAQIIHGSGVQTAELEQMRYEMQELRNRVNQQALTIDNLEGKVRSLPEAQLSNTI